MIAIANTVCLIVIAISGMVCAYVHIRVLAALRGISLPHLVLDIRRLFRKRTKEDEGVGHEGY